MRFELLWLLGNQFFFKKLNDFLFQVRQQQIKNARIFYKTNNQPPTEYTKNVSKFIQCQ